MLCLSIVALCLRALIPNGYMPTHNSDAKNGVLALSFCLPAGAESAAFEQFLQSLQDDNGHATEQIASIYTCPFSLAGLDTSLVLSVALVKLPAPTVRFVLPEAQAPPVRTTHIGPPLGSRAPPLV